MNCSLTLFLAASALTAQTVTSVASFDMNLLPPVSLIQGADGNFYGTTQFGGAGCPVKGEAARCGTIFQIIPGGRLTTIYRFGAMATGSGPAPVNGASFQTGIAAGSWLTINGASSPASTLITIQQ